MTLVDINEAHWDFLIDKMADEQAVLVLGPEAITDAAGKSFHSLLIEHLDVANNPNIYRHYPQDDFFFFDDAFKRTLLCHSIKKFYNEAAQPSQLLEKLSRLPFHIVLTVTPDKLYHRALQASGVDYQYGYYRKNQDPNLVQTPSHLDPLVYNVFGSVDNEESMILSHDDLYDYFKSIFARKSMPDNLKLALKQTKSIIFLGIPFDRWYMQLLLRELDLHNRQYEFIRFAANQTVSDQLLSFCYDQFRINFVNHRIPEFVDKLYQLCDDKEMLRQEGDQTEVPMARIRRLVTENNLKEALEILREQAKGGEYEDDVILLQNRFKRLEKRRYNDISPPDELNREENRITQAILELIHEIENLRAA